jgi:hypothetical protein
MATVEYALRDKPRVRVLTVITNEGPARYELHRLVVIVLLLLMHGCHENIVVVVVVVVIVVVVVAVLGAVAF